MTNGKKRKLNAKKKRIQLQIALLQVEKTNIENRIIRKIAREVGIIIADKIKEVQRVDMEYYDKKISELRNQIMMREGELAYR